MSASLRYFVTALATDLILDCERAASGRNRKRADPARWTETDWRQYLRAASRSPATSRLALLYHVIGDIRPRSAAADAGPLRRRSVSVAPIPNS